MRDCRCPAGRSATGTRSSAASGWRACTTRCAARAGASCACCRAQPVGLHRCVRRRRWLPSSPVPLQLPCSRSDAPCLLRLLCLRRRTKWTPASTCKALGGQLSSVPVAKRSRRRAAWRRMRLRAKRLVGAAECIPPLPSIYQALMSFPFMPAKCVCLQQDPQAAWELQSVKTAAAGGCACGKAARAYATNATCKAVSVVVIRASSQAEWHCGSRHSLRIGFKVGLKLGL